ncbi:MAG TPA: TRAP transporter substrate-binding protein DctP [Stellaceae bacterium]|jgi:TRAP-type C4-dicarboxylate transport system substrate-binding protein|nr:TRAP transporter substrate-binding protein DctP [Stellaceae bacterium]
MIRSVFSLAAGAAAFMTVAVASADEPVQLRYGDPGPTDASIHTDLVAPWADKVNRESGGTLDVKVFVGYSLVNMVNTLDRVANGVADLAFCILGPVSSQFPKTLVATLPFEAGNAHEAGLALQRLYDKGIIADEWTKVKPIGFGVFANASYHTIPPVKTMADLKGLKISVQGRLASETLQALGGTPISLPINEVYESLQRGMVVGAAIGWPAAVSFKLTDLAHNHVMASLGGEAAIMIMNNQSYAKLSGKAKQTIDANIETPYTNWFNKVIDDTEHDNIAIAQKMGNQSFDKLPPDELAKWKQQVEPVIDGWVKRTPDGANVLAAFRKEIAAIRAGS